MSAIRQQGLGWRPDLPDVRDRHLLLDHPAKAKMTEAVLPKAVSLREHCSDVRDQGQLGSCTGEAHAGAVDLLNRLDKSRLSTLFSPMWVYWQERFLEGTVDQDAGAMVRSGAKVLATLGICPESRWSYRIERFTRKPSATAFKDAARWKVGTYYRCFDLTAIRTALAHSFAVVGGFSCYSNMFTSTVDKSGDIPLPTGSLEGGHAVLFVGYDDDKRRLLIKNSWGQGWGDAGYGTLPYEFVESGQASDFWCYEGESIAVKH